MPATLKCRGVLLGVAFVLQLLPVSQTLPSASAQPLFSAFTPARLWQMVRVGEPEVSPNGDWIVFTITAWGPEAALPSVDLWLADSRGRDAPRQLTRSAEADFDPTWAPDSRSIVYAGYAEGSEASQLFLLDLRGGAPQPLTAFPTSVSRPRYLPDGEGLVFEARTWPDVGADLDALAARVSAARKETTWARVSESIAGGELLEGSARHLFRLSLASGEIADLTPTLDQRTNVSPFTWDLAPNGKYLTYAANTAPAPYLPRNSDVFVQALDDPRPRNLTEANPGADFRPMFSSDGTAVIFGRRQEPDALDEFNTLIRHQLRGDEQKAITDPALLSPTRWLTSSDGRQVIFLAQQRGRRLPFRVSISGGRARPLADRGSFSGLTRDDEDTLYFLHESLLKPPDLYRADADVRHWKKLTLFNQLYQQNTRLGDYAEFDFGTANGQSLHGFLLRPPGFNETRRWPLLVLLHGGPHSAWLDEFGWRWNLSLLATAGYVVAAPNVVGSTGYGQAHASAINGDPITRPVEDVAQVIRQLRALPYVDRSRVAVLGGSYGGMLAGAALTVVPELSAGVVHAGVFDPSLVYGSDFVWGRDRTWGPPPWRGGRLPANAPVLAAERISTPVLLLHGENDRRVPPVHAQLFHRALVGRGVPSRLVLFEETGHVVNQPQTARRWWREIFDWLGRYAPPGPQ
ncbi:MAG: S9 family peptidase [Pseudomonadota bacterium]